MTAYKYIYNRLFKVGALGCLLTLSALSSASDTTIEMCDSCHGNNGVSVKSDIPTISGIPEWNLFDQMMQYNDGRPSKTVTYTVDGTEKSDNMSDIIANLTESEIEDLALYYSEKPFVRAEQDFDDSLAKIGSQIHEKQCDSCHAQGGSDPEDEASILAGQQKEYLIVSMNQYRSEERTADKKMIKAIKKLTDNEIHSLAEYYASYQ